MSSLKSIAVACGKDVSTVSRALRDDPRVKEATREEIKAAAKAMGYTPNLAARSLRVGSSRTVWFFLPTVRNPLTQLATEYAAAYLREAGYDLLLAVHSNQEPVFTRLLSRIEQGVCDAAIIIPYGFLGEEQLNTLAARNYPVVFLDRHLESCDIPVFTTANTQAARALMRECVTDGVDAVVSLFGGNTVEDARNLGIEQEATSRKLPILDRNALKDNAPVHVAVFGSSQESVCRYYATNTSLLNHCRITFGVFDEWVGEPFPAEKVCVCEQDFKAMTQVAIDCLLSTIEQKTRVTFDSTSVPHKHIRVHRASK